jgi:GNAT superfamily N-acetyltransferase
MSTPVQDVNVTVRKASPADIPTIYALALAAWEPAYKKILSKEQIQYMFKELFSEDALEKQMNKQQHVFMIQYQDDVPTGFASFSLKEPIEKIYKLHRLYLAPEYLKKGLGGKLLHSVEKCIAVDGGTIMELNVNRKNGATEFYKHYGYRVHQTVDIPLNKYWLNDYIMRKKLNKENYL